MSSSATGDGGAGAPELRVWIDAQLPPALADWLRREFKVDAVHVKTLGLHQAEDSPIFDAARTAVDVVITKDDDFVRLLDRLGPPPRVLWVRCGNVKNAMLRDILLRAWPEAAVLFAAGESLVEVGRR